MELNKRKGLPPTFNAFALGTTDNELRGLHESLNPQPRGLALGSYNGKTGELAFGSSKLGKICLISAKFCRFLATLAGFRAGFALFFRKVEPIPSQSHYLTPVPTDAKRV